MTARATNINPRGYQFGFIYNELSNTKTIAHELCHGAYHLRHTFDEADYLAPEGTTDNLMDYATANDRTFNHWQWQDIHQPKNVRFKWAQDEEGAEDISVRQIEMIAKDSGISFNAYGRITYLTPAGKPFTLPQNVNVLEFVSNYDYIPDGALVAYKTTYSDNYFAVYKNKTEFCGYAKVINNDTKNINELDFEIDSYTKYLKGDDKVYVGKNSNNKIELYELKYSEIKNKEDVNNEQYNGSGEICLNFDYDLSNRKPIVIEDIKSSIKSKYAKEYYESAENIMDLELKSIIIRIATLMDLMAEESGGDALFDNYKKFASKEANPHYFGNPQLWGGSIDDYKLFEKALHSYLYGKQDLEELIKECDDNSKLTDYAWLYWYKYRDDIKSEIRNIIISKLAREEMRGNIFFGEGQEYLVLKYIETIPKTKGDCEAFIQFLQQDNNMQNLCKNIDDVTNDNYTKFIASLTRIFCIARNDNKPSEIKEKEIFDESRNDLFIWCKMFRDYEATPYHNRMYSTEYVNNQLVISQQNGFVLEFKSEFSYPAMDPFSWIYVTFLTAPDNIDDNVKAGDVIIMPAFLFAWMCNEYTNQKISDYIGDVVEVASLFVAVGQFNKAVKIYNALVLGASIANLADVKTWIEKNLGPEVATSWQMLSCIYPDSQTAFSALKNPQKTYDAIDAFLMAWDIYVLSNDIDNCKEKKAVESMVTVLREYKNIQ